VRLRADFALRAIQPMHRPAFPDAISQLMEALRDSEISIRVRAAETLGSMGADAAPAVPWLIETLKDNGNSSFPYIEALGRIARQDKEVITSLIQGLKPTNSNVAIGCALALSFVGPDAHNAAPHIASLVQDLGPHPDLALSLISIAPEYAIPILIVILNNKATTISCQDMYDYASLHRIAAAAGLGLVGSLRKEIALPALCNALNDPDDRVRRAASRSLRKLSPTEDCCRDQGPRGNAINVCPITHFRRRDKRESVIATIAMVAGTSCLELEARTGNAAHINITGLLNRLTGVDWEKWSPSLFRPSKPILASATWRARFPNRPHIVVISPPWRFWRSHVIAVFDTIVHDCHFENSYLISQYPRRNWRVTGVIEASSPYARGK
jgi:HEAT repeat